MQNEPLVSIITPCYNGEKYLEPYFESLLNQDYHNFEIIFVNDGSTDATEDIALRYGKLLNKRDIEFKYIFQENAGQAAAINRGLEIFSGDYLMWLDSDDVLYPNHLSEKVRFLEDNTDCGFVLVHGECVQWDKLDEAFSIIKRVKPEGRDNLFADLLNEHNVVFNPAVIMVRRNILLKAIPSRIIYTSRQGQNWQLMLPIAYVSKCGYLEKVLFKCVEHSNSHSRMRRSYSEWIERLEGFEELQIATVCNISAMSIEEKTKWCQYIKINIARKKLQMAYRFLKLTEINKLKKELVAQGGLIKISDTFMWFVASKIKARINRMFKLTK